MVRGNICYQCGRELQQWYTEEGDLTISTEKIVCPYCGWTLYGVMDLHEADNDQQQKQEQ